MGVPRPHYLTARLIGAFILGVGVLLCPDEPFAAEGPTLPPAEYKPLPVGTRVTYGDWSYTVKHTDGFRTVVKTNLQKWPQTYAVFGRQGNNTYTLRKGTAGGSMDLGTEWQTTFNKKNRSILESFWPLTVGKKAELNFRESFGTLSREWRLTFEVKRTEPLNLNGSWYPTFVVQVHATSEEVYIYRAYTPEQEYTETYWYNPDSGLVLKFNREWVRGSEGEPGDEYKLIKVAFPKGTTTHALKGTPIPKGGDEALLAEMESLKREAEKARAAEERKAREAEIARLKRETEAARTSGGAPFAAAAEGPTLPPAEYKPLPEGTRVRYDNWAYIVQGSDGFKMVIKDTRTGIWTQPYAVFGRQGEDVYTLQGAVAQTSIPRIWENSFNEKNRSILKGIWPLVPGKKVALEFEEILAPHPSSTGSRPWQMSLKVLRTERLDVNGSTYPTYVVQAHAISEKTELAYVYFLALEYKETYWYNPASGLVLKFEREWIRGGESSNADQYTLTGVTYPKGTTTHALKGVETVVAQRTVSEAAKDSAGWEKVKYSNQVSDFQRYLEEFPSGMFVKIAESQMRALIERQVDPEAVKNQFAGIDFGAYHALVIGINDYKYLPKLKIAVTDAKAVASMLEKHYGFKVNLLIDPERAAIIDALDEYRETLGPKDNLLIYYAGHGWLDEEADEGYWLTRSAKPNRRSRWISNAAITNTLKVLAAKHVMVVADSCYSGTLTRSAAAIGFRDKEYYKRMAVKQARVALVSGGLEPVADGSGKGNSPFAAAFLDALRGNPDVIDGTRLFSKLRRPVMLNAQQTPQYSDVRNAGHEGGDFLFVRKR